MSAHAGFGHVSIPPKPDAPTDSWWADAERACFTLRCEAEAARMRGSKGYQQVGMPPIVGQIDGRKPKH